jgi:hypothetical protein
MREARLRRKTLKRGRKKIRHLKSRSQRLQETELNQALTRNAAVVQNTNGLITIIIQIPIQIFADSSNVNDSQETNHQQ